MPYDRGPSEPPWECGVCQAGIWQDLPTYWLTDYPHSNEMIYPYCSAQCSLDDYQERNRYAKVNLPDIHTLNNMVKNLLEEHDANAPKK